MRSWRHGEEVVEGGDIQEIDMGEHDCFAPAFKVTGHWGTKLLFLTSEANLDSGCLNL